MTAKPITDEIKNGTNLKHLLRADEGLMKLVQKKKLINEEDSFTFYIIKKC